jgi:hypothetical protein
VPKYKLEVLDEDSELTSVADMHKNGFLVVDSDGSESESFIVTNLIAEDSFNSVELIDSKGYHSPFIKNQLRRNV